jgi:hypothetical protein
VPQFTAALLDGAHQIARVAGNAEIIVKGNTSAQMHGHFIIPEELSAQRMLSPTPLTLVIDGGDTFLIDITKSGDKHALCEQRPPGAENDLAISASRHIR